MLQGIPYGADDGTRTHDLFLTKEVLYLLSYISLLTLKWATMILYTTCPCLTRGNFHFSKFPLYPLFPPVFHEYQPQLSRPA